jgi:DegV family protein with EDD domain
MNIVTDSGMDITPGVFSEIGIEVHQVPLKIELDGKTYRSGVDIQKTDSLPVTSLPSPGDFVELYKRLAAYGPILSIHISSGLSNTIQSAMTAAQMVPEAVVTFIDTFTLSGAQGWQVEAAARAVKAGWPVEKIVELVAKVRKATETVYTLPDLKYLIHGGRISHMKGLLANLLNIKPLIGVSKTDGKYYERGKSATFRRAIENIGNVIAKDVPEGSEIRVQVASVANSEGANHLHELLDKRFSCHWLPESTVAPALGAHTGVGLVGAFYAPLRLFPELP